MAAKKIEEGLDNSVNAEQSAAPQVDPMGPPPSMTPPMSQPMSQPMSPPMSQPTSPMGPPAAQPIGPPPLGQGSMGPPPPGMSAIGAPPMHLTPPPELMPSTSPVQLHNAAANAGPRQPMLTPSAPIPMMQQAQALMRKPAFMTQAPPSNTRTKMVIAAVAGLLVAGAVVAVLITHAGDDGDASRPEDTPVAGNASGGGAALSAEHQAIWDKLPADARERLKALPPHQLAQILDAKAKARKAETAKVPTKPAVTKAAGSTWDGRRTFTCRGNDVHVLRNVRANTGRRMAILAKNGCVVYCVDCTIVSRNRYAVRTHNTAKVYLIRGKIIAKKYALYALHSSTIVYAGTKVLGRRKRQNQAKLRKLKPDEVQVPE